ncbi:MAG: molybdopterin molybdenumtransferase MoeA [SAR202 cluster bacterium]|nr:molybdopterin molybdenumtransferase MoeA [SAR202 cluster bacterium]|tara:strand:- start:2332 stop:3567 length:1236 start_codon:yes stop_codon:yes gene_type:complete
MPELFTVVTPQEALEKLKDNLTHRVASETVKTNLAIGRVTAGPIYSSDNLPTFPRSTMDGYAVIASDTYGSTESIPAYINLIGEIPMGQPSDLILTRGNIAKVHTGSMLPEGSDAVVMVENTQIVDAQTIEIVRPVAPGENILQVGDDIAKGQIILPEGHLLRAQDIGGLMGLGITELNVYGRPKVVIISTGDELIPPNKDITPGKIRDINTYSLAALTLQSGAIPLTTPIIGDSFEELLDAARKSILEADMLVISAGSSVSTRDLTSAVISNLGDPGILVHGISIKPGKPTILASIEGKPVVGLPGNPVSALVIFDIFCIPSIYMLSGCSTPPDKPNVDARITHNLASIPGREDYIPVKLRTEGEILLADPIFGESNLITTVMKADGLIKIPLDKSGIYQGEIVNAKMFR